METHLFLGMDLQQAQRQLTADLTPLYGHREAALITDWIFESLTGRKKSARLTRASEPLPGHLLQQYEKYRAELLAHRPVQYVLHESWFAGMKFYVDENVLIPRPETEELVQWAIETITPGLPANPQAAKPQAVNPASVPPGPQPPNLASVPPGPLPPNPAPFPPGPQPATSAAPALLDVGAGSGCIAITLAKKLPALQTHACDISGAALGVARRNAAALGAPIHFHQLDFLDSSQWTRLPAIRWLISNPPYIPQREHASMPSHVTGSEPALALFVPDADPLVFYRALAEFARLKLAPEGSIFVEIHEDLASGTLDVFRTAGFQQVLLRKDMQGRDRMIRASGLRTRYVL